MLSRLESEWLRALVRERGADSVLAAIAEHAGRPCGIGDASSGLEAIASLTPRERQVLIAYARGRQVKEVARELGMAVSNAKRRMADVRRKLGIHRRAQAADLVLRAGLQ